VPAVDFLNGEVVRRGADVGVPTPVNAAIRDFVLAIADGRRASSRASLIELFEATRRV
jgi:2-dehydropantoate 2-reductase